MRTTTTTGIMISTATSAVCNCPTTEYHISDTESSNTLTLRRKCLSIGANKISGIATNKLRLLDRLATTEATVARIYISTENQIPRNV